MLMIWLNDDVIVWKYCSKDSTCIRMQIENDNATVFFFQNCYRYNYCHRDEPSFLTPAVG